MHRSHSNFCRVERSLSFCPGRTAPSHLLEGMSRTSDLSDFLLVFRQQSLRCIFWEASLDHFLDTQGFHTQQIQYHVISQSKLRCQLPRYAQYHRLKGILLSQIWVQLLSSETTSYLRKRISREYNDCSCAIKTTTPSSASHLGIFTGKDISETATIVFSDTGEYYAFGRHIDSLELVSGTEFRARIDNHHGKCFCGKKCFHESACK